MDYKITKSEMAQALLVLKGKPLRFEAYKAFTQVYDVTVPFKTLKAGRQIGKSVNLAGEIVIQGCGKPFFNTLYIAPQSIQTTRFSTMYVDAYVENSPLIRKYYKSSSSLKNVFEKSFSTGSRIFLSYASEESDADRIRGISANSTLFDEVQDISEAALPAILEVMSGQDEKYVTFAGTSKSVNNTLELMYLRSNQLEYCSKCAHCAKWIVPNDYDICYKICTGSPEGPVCPYCGKPHDPTTGLWVAGRPTVKDHAGFHLPQFIFSANTSAKRWPSLYSKITNGTYPKVKISNEVFGLAEDLAGRTFSIRDLLNCCDESKLEFDPGRPRDTRGICRIVVGVDWSVTGSTASYTVISVLGFDMHGKAFLLYLQRLQGVDILEQVARVKQVFQVYDADMLACDRGVGVLQWQILERDLGSDRVSAIQYVAAKSKLRYDREGRFFAADRTQAIDQLVMRIKQQKKKMEFPRAELMDPFFPDFMSIYEEESNSGRRLFRKDADTPDDVVHSLTFALMGFQILNNDVSFEAESKGFFLEKIMAGVALGNNGQGNVSGMLHPERLPPVSQSTGAEEAWGLRQAQSIYASSDIQDLEGGGMFGPDPFGL